MYKHETTFRAPEVRRMVETGLTSYILMTFYNMIHKCKLKLFCMLLLQSKYDSLITQLRAEMQHERETYAVERHKLASHLEQAVKESKDFSSLLRQREEVRDLDILYSLHCHSLCIAHPPFYWTSSKNSIG